MHPQGRPVFDLDDQGGGDDDGAGNHDDEDRGTIAGVNEGIVELAGLASRSQIEEARIELALAATRAFTGEPAQRAFSHGGGRIASHVFLRLSPCGRGKTERTALRPPRCSLCEDRLLGAYQSAAAGAPDVDA